MREEIEPVRSPRLKFTVRALLALVAVVAIALASVERLFVGDGGVDLEIVNAMDKPIQDLRLACKGRDLTVDILRPGASMRGRLWPAEYSPGGNLDANFGLTYTVMGKVKHWSPAFTINLLRQEPNVRIDMGERDGEEAWSVTFPHVPVSPTRLLLRRCWFQVFPLRW